MIAAPDSIIRLCETFSTHSDHYKSKAYNETQLRREFLDPFFKALGWDIDNEQGYADAYKDVIHEDAIKIGGYTKAPDYCFRIGGQRKFFLEAKKPAIDIQEDIYPAYQLRRYAWSAKLPLSILSDFEELSIYDCRIRPRSGDKASTARTLYLTYDQYVDRWAEIAGIFSRDAVLKGSFDKYTIDAKRHRGTETVDDAFLEEIERWRNHLARNFALRNPSLSVRDLNFAVQKTIDRIIFLRICEDRGTEDYKRLATILSNERIYAHLLELFKQADARYNSGLFHFSSEDGRGAPDNVTPNLELDDRVLKDIISKLYYPESPYEFSVLSADILGQVYEQFLGKTIRLTHGHQAKIEDKPEVRKAGGVYYTPSYIVDYIVKSTLGRQLNGSDPNKPRPIPVSKAAEIKVLDPACGSGSFLIVAYQYLLDWHLRQYTADPETSEPDEGKIKRHSGGKNPKIYQAPGGTWELTTDECKRILLNNIFGVDIDAQAVEVTKLSLLLKVMEGETHQIKQRDWIRERQRILPDLENNIKCGNSLIGPDFYDNEQMLLLEKEAQYRINAFDWNQGFPEIMNRGGFDCVIGNPPYVRQESIKESKEYLSKHYESASGTADLYVYFLEKAVRLLCDDGYASYIVSSSFLKTTYAKLLRGVLKEHSGIVQIVDFGGLPVFVSAKDTYVCIPIFQKAPQPETIIVHKINTLKTSERTEQLEASGFSVSQSRFNQDEWALRSDSEDVLYHKLIENNTALGKVVDGLYYGIKTGLNKAFLISLDETSKFRDSADKHTNSFIHSVYGGQDIRRYHLHPLKTHLICIPAGWTKNTYGALGEVQAWKRLAEENPALSTHLTGYREALIKRQDKGDYWWELRPCDYYNIFDSEKIIFPDICKNPRFFLDGEGSYVLNTAYAINSCDRYLLGFLNSRLFWWLIAQISIPFGVRAGEFRYRLIYQYMKKIPIRLIDFDNPDDVGKHDKIVVLVGRMLELKQRKAEENNPETLRLLETQLVAIDSQIDNLVYNLYGLTTEEILLVEQGASPDSNSV